MPKAKRKGKVASAATTTGYEVIEESTIRDAVTKLIDFCESKKLSAKIVLLAMEHITSKIRDHLEIETIEIQDVSNQKH